MLCLGHSPGRSFPGFDINQSDSLTKGFLRQIKIPSCLCDALATSTNQLDRDSLEFAVDSRHFLFVSFTSWLIIALSKVAT